MSNNHAQQTRRPACRTAERRHATLSLLSFGMCLTWLLAVAAPVRAIEPAEIPTAAPRDAVMAGADELAAMDGWVRQAFGLGEAKPVEAPITVTVRRQDHAMLHFGRSCLDTPLKIGQQDFSRGLGTHANSEIAVTVPPGIKRFKAMVGIDNNYDTGGVRGSVQFSVEVGGKEIYRTPTVNGGQDPLAVDLELPADTREIALKVDTTPDGPGHDQSDWADAHFVAGDGRVVWIEGSNPPLLTPQLPFSFQYGGKPVSELIGGWQRSIDSRDDADALRHTVAWTDAATGLRVTAAVTQWKQYPAVEWVLYFKNQGAGDTPVVADIQALDLPLGTAVTKRPVVLHHLVGDVCGERSFLPLDTEVEAGKAITLAPGGGRPSNGAFPFFNVQYGDQGLITAIGWSGQWNATLARAASGVSQLRAGMEKTHLVLHPGEEIRSPRILLMAWRGSRPIAHNRFRRLMLFHYVPRIDGRPLALPVAGQCFDRYSWTRPEWATEAGQIRTLTLEHEAGCDTHWFDAAWFEGGFPSGVGNWYHKPKEFPRGLKPVSDACRERGMRFIVWFEPERVAAGSLIAREHPEFVFGGAEGGLFKLGDPAARRWMTDLLSQRIDEFGIDTYRNDFNIDPLGFWRKDEAPDRQGINEIRYVEGHYAMWDELRARHPGLWIDNCASGGRRIDLETCMRSVPLWRSDTSCSPGHAEWNQVQTYGLSQYIPLATACGWTPEAYDLRSSATGGAICQFDFFGEQFSMAEAQAALAEVKENQKYWYGDFYPLTPCSTGTDQWIAYQFHRADLDAGIVLAFRRSQSIYPAACVSLAAIDPAATYRVELIDHSRQKTEQTLAGKQLADEYELRLPERATSLLVRYKKQ